MRTSSPAVRAVASVRGAEIDRSGQGRPRRSRSTGDGGGYRAGQRHGVPPPARAEIAARADAAEAQAHGTRFGTRPARTDAVSARRCVRVCSPEGRVHRTRRRPAARPASRSPRHRAARRQPDQQLTRRFRPRCRAARGSRPPAGSLGALAPATAVSDESTTRRAGSCAPRGVSAAIVPRQSRAAGPAGQLANHRASRRAFRTGRASTPS
jgi:hypothetical protein